MKNPHRPNRLGVVLGGGGARAAYQVGFLRFIAREIPDLAVPIYSGTSAGAINAAHLASHPGSFQESVESLSDLWQRLTVDQVFRQEGMVLFRTMFRWGIRLLSGGRHFKNPPRGLVDTAPLREFLKSAFDTEPDHGHRISGIAENIDAGRLYALAVTSTNYGTGQSMTWVEGSEDHRWERTHRRGIKATIGLDHVMASSALPFFFPAIQLGSDWHGDGGVRQTAPLSPTLHLGATKILAMSTRYLPQLRESNQSMISGYPPPAQVAGVMFNAIFLDALESDAANLERINSLLEQIPEDQRGDLRPVQLLTARPSLNLGKLAADYEAQLPQPFRFLERGLGTRETRSPDSLSMLMFQPEYLNRLIELGESDAEELGDAVLDFVAGEQPEGFRSSDQSAGRGTTATSDL